ncbi:MAG: dephospho-CoA kinase [Polyangiaceae bacterium]|nr:dephospho-CoA kinase [Polyangiaceae bacterium]
MSKPVIGLTGGIASGKSTVARMFAELGVPIVDADQLAREVVDRGSPGLARIVERFGSDVLAADGTLDRRKLARIVFDDPRAREDLNTITHPLIAAQGAERVRELQRTAAPYIVYEAALLVENGSYKVFSALIVVAANSVTQLARVMARDGSTEEEARARIAAQLPLERKVEVADYVIRNEGNTAELRAQVAEVHRQLLERFAVGVVA